MNSVLVLPADTADLSLLVRLARVARRLKQADLADIAGVLPQQVSALERGAYLHPAARERILTSLGLAENRNH
jgi:transcriptional regulator with XRE-family HTH domain